LQSQWQPMVTVVFCCPRKPHVQWLRAGCRARARTFSLRSIDMWGWTMLTGIHIIGCSAASLNSTYWMTVYTHLVTLWQANTAPGGWGGSLTFITSKFG
jgi:hypothetical protein